MDGWMDGWTDKKKSVTLIKGSTVMHVHVISREINVLARPKSEGHFTLSYVSSISFLLSFSFLVIFISFKFVGFFC